MPQIQDTFIRVLEPLRRAEPRPDAKDAEPTTDAGVDRSLHLASTTSGRNGGWCVCVRARTLRSVRRWGEEEETEEEKVGRGGDEGAGIVPRSLQVRTVRMLDLSIVVLYHPLFIKSWAMPPALVTLLRCAIRTYLQRSVVVPPHSPLSTTHL